MHKIDLKPYKQITVAYLEDDVAQQTYISNKLSSHQYQCQVYSTANDIKRAFCDHTPCDIALLDWDLGAGETGLEVVDYLRTTRDRSLPIIMVSARQSTADVEIMLHAGANDVLHKPVAESDLLRVIEAYLNRDESSETGEYGCYQNDTINKMFTLHGEQLELTEPEYTIASLLFSAVGQLRTNTTLIATLNASGIKDIPRVELIINRIRKKMHLKETGVFRLEPIHTCGYRLSTLH